MKKLFSIFALLLAGTTMLNAQNVVNGTVVDKDGNPIPGVKVEVVGGTESVLTELDGTFRLETAVPAKKVKVMYAGMQSKQQKIKPGMVVKMRNSSWWNNEPEEYEWFAGVQMYYPSIGDFKFDPSFGVTFGRLKNIGWYVKGVYNKQDNDYWYDKYISVTAGFIGHLWSPIYYYVGAGYSYRDEWGVREYYSSYNGYRYDKYYGTCYDDFALDLGFMVRFNRAFVNLGLTLNDLPIQDPGAWLDNCEPVFNFGVGVFF